MSGLHGWLAAALMIGAVGCQLVAVVALMWLAYNKDPRNVALWAVVLLASFPLAAAAVTLRFGWRRVTVLLRNSVPKEQFKALLLSTVILYLALELGFGGFIYLAFTLEGGRRLALASAALFFGMAISDLATGKIYEILRVRFPRGFGQSRKRTWVIAGVSVLAGGFFLLTGLFWPDLMPT
jgi:hypothetical protein